MLGKEGIFGTSNPKLKFSMRSSNLGRSRLKSEPPHPTSGVKYRFLARNLSCQFRALYCRWFPHYRVWRPNKLTSIYGTINIWSVWVHWICRLCVASNKMEHWWMGLQVAETGWVIRERVCRKQVEWDHWSNSTCYLVQRFLSVCGFYRNYTMWMLQM